MNAQTEPMRAVRPAAAPFLKWAGGKRWLAARVVHLIGEVHGQYIEPFLGGGSVFFYLNPKQAVLSDANCELITAYAAVRTDPKRVERLLREHQRHHSIAYYYQQRDYKPRCPFRIAARFIYLNRTCWNGLYRVNLQGVFNVPIGTKSTVLLPADDWQATSLALQKAQLRCEDFEPVMEEAKDGDVIFADPPYTVKHNLNGFIKYNDALFSWSDQVRLRDAAVRAKKRGARVIVTNANHESVRELYRSSGRFHFEAVTRASVLAGSASHRGKFDELLIR